MKIKVCGLREEGNIADLYNAGIRTMGFIFYGKSKRFVHKDDRKSLFASIPMDVEKVGVFVNEPLAFVIDTISTYGLDYAQLHGEENRTFCAEVQKYAKVIKAFRVDESFKFETLNEYQNCDLLLFDAKGKEYGGNGIKYDWQLLEQYKLKTPFLLSGGIGPDDVDKILAFDHARFIGIDINSGFEIEPGLKDIEKIKSFISYLKCNTQ
jgi:phosphoribosylanthranilate isomerase